MRFIVYGFACCVLATGVRAQWSGYAYPPAWNPNVAVVYQRPPQSQPVVVILDARPGPAPVDQEYAPAQQITYLIAFKDSEVRAVGVAELLTRGDVVSDELLEFLDVGEALRSFARPDDLAVRANVKDASDPRDEREFAYLVLERGEQLLRHPGGAEKPAALLTVFYF